MMRRKKESGFTLIELMIVIAVIGILAVVLIPKVGTIKTQAKASGIDTNLRTVQGYVQSVVTNATSNNFNTGLVSAFSPTATDAVQNPFFPNLKGAVTTNTNGPTAAIYVDATVATDNHPSTDTNTSLQGMIRVYSVASSVPGPITRVYLLPYDDKGVLLGDKIVTITP